MLKKLLARVLIAVALRLFFLRHKVDLLEHADHGNMGELYVYRLPEVFSYAATPKKEVADRAPPRSAIRFCGSG
jgi:hypothetical protein